MPRHPYKHPYLLRTKELCLWREKCLTHAYDFVKPWIAGAWPPWDMHGMFLVHVTLPRAVQPATPGPRTVIL